LNAPELDRQLTRLRASLEADPELRPLVVEAKRKVARLTASEKR
jgi:hypothetical protein